MQGNRGRGTPPSTEGTLPEQVEQAKIAHARREEERRVRLEAWAIERKRTDELEKKAAAKLVIAAHREAEARIRRAMEDES